MALIAVNAIWEYQTTTNDIPADPAAVTVPSSSWTAGGVAPFGTATTYDPDPTTAWALNSGLWMRRNVVLDGSRAVQITGTVDNGAFFYWDGEYIGSFGGDLTTSGAYTLVVPMELCTPGTHSIAVLAMDDDASPGGDQSYISLEADYLPPLMPFQPRAPVRESLSWLTDVQTAKDGTEDRTQYRIKARQDLRFIYPTADDQMRRAFLLVYDQRHEQWCVPVWMQATNPGAIAEGDTSVAAPGLFGDYRAGEYALLWQSHTVWQIVTVDVAGANTISFLEPARAFTNAWIMPIRFGFMKENPSKALTGFRAEYEVTFQIEDNIDLAPAAPAQFLGEDIYFNVSLLSGEALSDDIIGNLELQDEDLGVVKYYAPWINSKVARTHRVLAESPRLDAYETVNIAGTDLHSGSNVRTFSGLGKNGVIEITKPRASSAFGLLWDAYSPWSNDTGYINVPVEGYTWQNEFFVYGNNGGGDVLLYSSADFITPAEEFYATADEAWAALNALGPLRFHGYDTFKVVGVADSNAADNRGGLSLLVRLGEWEPWTLREWLYRRAGRFRGFWHPSFEADLKLVSTGAISTTLNVDDDGYIVYGTQHRHIAIEATTGWLARTVTNAVRAGSTAQLTLNASLGVNASVIKRICWLGFKRLNSDSVELNWSGGGICEADMRLLELNA